MKRKHLLLPVLFIIAAFSARGNNKPTYRSGNLSSRTPGFESMSDGTRAKLAMSLCELPPDFSDSTFLHASGAGKALNSLVATSLAADTSAMAASNNTPVAYGSALTVIPLNVYPNTELITVRDRLNVNSDSINVIGVPSSNAILANLTISQGVFSPAFAGNVFDYTVNVGNAVTSLAVTPVAGDLTDQITVNGTLVASGNASDPVALNVGQNTITVVVTAPETTNTYTLTVTRAGSPDVALAGLSISNGTLSPAFSGSVTNYTSSVSIAKKQHTVYTIGDSITAKDEYPQALDALLNYTFDFINFAIPGDITLDMVKRFPALAAASPDYVIIFGGSNDIANFKFSASYIEKNFETMYTAAHNAGTKVIALAITPYKGAGAWNESRQLTLDSVNTWILSHPLNADYVIDTYSLLADPANPDQLLPAYASNDHLHPNLAGMQLIAQLIYSSVPFTPNPAVDQLNAAKTSEMLTPVANSPNATISVNGISVNSGAQTSPISLSMGANNIATLVTAPDGITQQTYNLNVTGTPSTNANLANLYINPGGLYFLPAFAEDQLSYTVPEDYTTLQVQVRAYTVDANATLTINGMPVISGNLSNYISLNVGVNICTVVVTAQDGVTTKTYTIAVTRASVPDGALVNLQLGNGLSYSPAFSTYGLYYFANVPSSVSTVQIIPTTNDPAASVSVNNQKGLSGTVFNIPLTGVNDTVIIAAQANYRLTLLWDITNANLSKLRLSEGALSPAFVKSTLNYSASVNARTTSIQITPFAADATSTITVNGTAVATGTASPAIPLAPGSNIITVVVTAKDGVTKVIYTITVTRPILTNATLSSLKFSSGALSPAFSPGITGYTANVGNGTSSVTLTPVTADPDATVTINGTHETSGAASAAIPLAFGATIINIVVTAQDGVTTKTYTVTVNRALSTIANLANLSVKTAALSPVFNSRIFTYTSSVGNSTNLVTVTPTVIQANAAITVNGAPVTNKTASAAIPLMVGSNTITIAVIAQDGVTQLIYTVTITRAPSSVATLSNLQLSNGGTLTPVFASATTSYAATVATTTTSITVTPTTTDPTATITVNDKAVTSNTSSGAIKLVKGTNTITTVVTAQDGVTTETYTLTVTRDAGGTNDAYLASFSIRSATLSPAFAFRTLAYTSSVSNATKSVTVRPSVLDIPATVTVNGMAVANKTSSGPIELAVGSNTINIVVTAPDGITTQTYTVMITRAAGGADGYVPIAIGNGINIGVQNFEPLTFDDGIVVHQGVSPNGDGINDFLQIDNISQYPENKLSIMKRNGQLIYEATGYDNSSKVFDGHSNKNGQMQQPGTYFYQLDYVVAGITKHKTGFLVLKY